jgi:hypothetical protein
MDNNNWKRAGEMALNILGGIVFVAVLILFLMVP